MKRQLMAALMVGAALLSPASSLAQQAATREYVFVGSGGGGNPGQVTTYRLDRATGDLTQIDREDVGGQASFMAANPNQPMVYVTAERGGEMHWVRVDPATGMFSAEGSRAGSGNPVYASVDATGSVLLAVNYGAGTTDAFPLDPETGAIAGPATTYDTGANSHSAVFHPNNRFAYAASVADNKVSQYALENGALTPLTPPSIVQPGGPRHFTVHPNGEYAYAIAGGTNNVFSFAVGSDGRLTQTGSAPRLEPQFASEAGRHMGSDIEVTPSGRFVYAANRGQSNTLVIYSVGSDGRLTLIGHESTRGNTPRNLSIDPDGELIVVGNQDSQTVSVFRANPETGALTHLNTEEVGVSPFFVEVFRIPAE